MVLSVFVNLHEFDREVRFCYSKKQDITNLVRKANTKVKKKGGEKKMIPNFTDTEFRKSSFSRPSFACVEVAMKEGYVALRNSKDPQKNTIVFTVEEWDAFLKGAKMGEFEIP